MSDIPPPVPETPAPVPPPMSSAPPPPPPAASYAPGAAVSTADGTVDSGPVGKPRSIGLVIFLTIITLGFWTWIWSYQNGAELKQHARTGLGGLAYLLITMFISPVTMFLMAGEVEQLYRREGKEPPITTIWGLWFLLPLIGHIIWYVRIQKSLNEYWVAHGATA